MTIDGRTFEGRTALVTGGTRGLGAAIAMRLASAGAQVLVSGCTAASEHELPFVQADMSVAAEVTSLAHRALDRLGRVDLLVSNAGHQTRRAGGAFDFTDEDWTADLSVNLMAAVRLDRLLVPGMVERRRGSVVHISSGAAHIARPASVAYSASKAALEVYSKALATQVGPSEVRVNVVSPGLIRNSSVEALAAEQDISSDELLNRTAAALQIPLGRAGSAEELAAAVVFLLSPDASYLTGSVWRVDGGSFPTT